MNHKKGLMLFAVIPVLLVGFYLWPYFQRRTIDESFEITNQVFKVRISAYQARDIFPVLAGRYYEFQSSSAGSQQWVTIMTFRHDDPVSIPREQVRFVDSQIGYVFMGWMYAVTTNGGDTWSVWNAEKDLPGWECCNYGLIQSVSINPQGIGNMILHPIPGRPGEVPLLKTSDYGRHWSQE
jgi:hypothetical protein